MTQASGLGSQWGLAKETTYGTAVTVAKFYEFDSESLALDQNFNDSIGLRAGRMFQPSGRMQLTTRGAGGSVGMQVPNKLFGTILDLMHGATITPTQQAASAAYLQTHNIGTSQPNKSATLQVNRPDISATDHAFTYPGSVLTSVTFTGSADGVLTCSLTWDCRDETTPSTTPAGAALATASYATGVTSWIGSATGITVNVNSVDVSQFVSSWSLTWTQPYQADAWRMGQGSLKRKPIPNGLPTVTGTIEADWDAETRYLLYRAGSIIDVYADFQGPIIASTYHEQIKFDCTAAQIRGGGAAVGGPDVLSQTIEYTAGDNGSSVPLIVQYMSTDITI
jgi:hypothetical protein